MCLTITLDLGDFIHRLPARPCLCPFARQRIALEGPEREHLAIGKVAIVGDGQQRSAGLLLPLGHPLPKVLRVLAVEGGHRQHLVGLVLAVPVDHVAVEVVAAAGIARPFDIR